MISIIIPSYNEQDNIRELHRRLDAVSRQLPDENFEFIFIDDCSNDETEEIISQIVENDPRVKTIRFARNCGSHAAVAAGLEYCTGNAAIMLAADLQDPPELIPKLLAEWKKGSKIVWGVREERKGENPGTLLFSKLFYLLMNRLTDITQPPTGADVFLIDRRVIEVLKKHPEKNASVYMLIAWLGFFQTSVSYVKETRHAGESKWTLTKKLKLFFDSLISFSYVPLRFMSMMGSVSALLGLLYGFVVLIRAIFGGAPVEGWSSLMIVVLLMGGFQMIMMGMLGEYLWRTYDESRGRPRYVVEKNTIPKWNPDGKKQGEDG